MSVGSFFKSIFGGKTVTAVEAFALSEAQKAVAALKHTTIGTIVASDIKALCDSTLPGAQKFDQVLEITMPLIAKFLTDGGVKTAVVEVEDVARSLAQEIFNDTVSTEAGGFVTAILKLLGLT